MITIMTYSLDPLFSIFKFKRLDLYGQIQNKPTKKVQGIMKESGVEN